MILFALALLCVGGLVFALSGVWTLALAFQRHVIWGLAVLLVPLGNVAFLFVNWREGRVPFFLGLASLGFIGSAASTLPQESVRTRLHGIFAMVQEDRQREKARADEGMLAARREAELQVRLLTLKRQEDKLLGRKAHLDPADEQGAQLLSEEIRRYNADLQPLLAQLKTASE